MATQYPTSQEDLIFEITRLRTRIEELVTNDMRKSAKLSEAEEKLKRIQTEAEIVALQTGHNLCWVNLPRLIKAILGHTGKYPDPEDVTREEFAIGCRVYQNDLFGPAK